MFLIPAAIALAAMRAESTSLVTYVARRYRQPVQVADSTTPYVSAVAPRPAAPAVPSSSTAVRPPRSRPYTNRRRRLCCRCSQPLSSPPQPSMQNNVNEPSPPTIPLIDLSQPSSPPQPPINPPDVASVPAAAEQQDVSCSGYESDVEKILQFLK